MIVRRDCAWTFDADDQTMLCRMVEREGVIRLDLLAQFIGCEEHELERMLSTHTLAERVECLRPLFGNARSTTIFCRWRTSGDRNYVWEQNYFEGRGPCRVSGNRA